MKMSKSTWFYIIAAAITILGIVTGWYFFFLIMLPLGFFNFKDKNNDH
jgi:hypothetical protein